LVSILRDRALLPNDGRFPETYPQSKASYAKQLGAISLFDFDTEPVDSILDVAWKYVQFFRDQGAATIMIRIRRSALNNDRLIIPSRVPNSAKPRIEVDGRHVLPIWIPHVEVLHIGQIHTRAFCEYLVMRKSDDSYVRVPARKNALRRVRELSKRWEADPQPIDPLIEAILASSRVGVPGGGSSHG
jgi:hypothetical protein